MNVSQTPTGSEIISLEKLAPEIRQLAERYAEISGAPGVLVGALLDNANPWNLRCLTFDNGVLKVIRFSDPAIGTDPAMFQVLGGFMRKLSVLNEKYQVWSVGANAGRFWALRNYFQTTLSEIAEPSVVTLGAEPQMLAHEMVQIVYDLSRDGIVHGHICPENVSVEKNVPVLLDFGFAAFSPALRARSMTMAPECRDEGRVSPRADIYGLGLVIHKLLGRNATEPQRSTISAMVQPDPSQRPDIKQLLGIFGPGIPTTTMTGLEKPSRRKRQQAFQLGATRSADEALDWAKGTVSLSADIISKIQSAVAEDTTPEQMAHLSKVLEERTSKERTREQTSAATESRESEGTRVPSSSGSPHVATERIEKRPDLFGGGAPQTPHGQTIPQKEAGNGRPVHKDAQSRKALHDRLWLGGFFLVLLLGIVYLRGGFNSLYVTFFGPDIPYQSYWMSGRPSRMAEVAIAALEYGDTEAQDIIVEDVLSGGDRPRVLTNFLRQVFDPRWESELLPEDREMALRIGLFPLKKDLLKESPQFAELHPAVILAEMVLLPLEQEDPSMAGIPLTRLSALPPPVGSAFIFLEQSGVKTCDAVAARAMARILQIQDASELAIAAIFQGAKSVKSVAERFRWLYLYTRGHPAIRKTLLSFGRKEAPSLNPLLQWFDGSALKLWKDVNSEQRLALVAGAVPTDQLRPEERADLLTFPLASVRKKAVAAMVEDLSDEELPIFEYLMRSSNVLSRAQTSFLAMALTAEGESQYVLLSQWFDTGPDVDVVMELLLSRSLVKKLDPFSIEAARYLTNREWNDEPAVLKELLVHQEALVRALALSKLSANTPDERRLLEEAYRTEQNERLRKQITLKLEEAVS